LIDVFGKQFGKRKSALTAAFERQKTALTAAFERRKSAVFLI
jgi:hypothetical protein